MQHLSLAGVSDDGRRLLLVDDSGTEFTLDVDSRLRATLRGDHARIGQLEKKMDSTLRPRDIQARIRAGESPDQVAAAAGTDVEKIMAYAAPVLAERAHIAQRAQRSSLRRRNGDNAGARTLGDAVAAQLRGLNVDPEGIEWDAWRREDGRWHLSAVFEAGQRIGDASFAFDAPGNYVVTENDDARWLIGDEVAVVAAEPARNDLAEARARRLRPDADFADEALDIIADDPAPAAPAAPAPPAPVAAAAPAPVEERTVDLSDTAARIRGAATAAPAEPVELSPTPEPFTEREAPAAPAEAAPAAAEEAPVEAPKPKPAAKKRGRASVPSWDEIMFGGPTGSDS